MLSTVHCDVAVNLTTELAEEQAGSELKYEGTLFTTEKQHSNDSVRTSGNSQIKDDRYTTDVDEVQDNISESEGPAAQIQGDTTEEWTKKERIPSDGYRGRQEQYRSARIGTYADAYNLMKSTSSRNCSIVDPGCNPPLLNHQNVIHNSDILQSVYSLITQYGEEKRKLSSLLGPSDLITGNIKKTKDKNERQQKSIGSHVGTEEKEVTEAATTNPSVFEQRLNVLLRNCSNIIDQNCRSLSSTAYIPNTSTFH